MKNRAALHSAALLDSCTAEVSDQCTSSSWYGCCSCYANSWKTSIVSSGSVNTFITQWTILTGHVTVTAAAVITVTDRDKVHRSTAVSWQWYLIQQVSHWCPMSVHLIWILPYKHAPSQLQANSQQMVKFSYLSSTSLTAFKKEDHDTASYFCLQLGALSIIHNKVQKSVITSAISGSRYHFVSYLSVCKLHCESKKTRHNNFQ